MIILYPLLFLIESIFIFYLFYVYKQIEFDLTLGHVHIFIS